MTYQVSKDVIAWLWDALQAPRRRRRGGVMRQMAKIAESGWASESDIRDLLEDSDARLITDGGLHRHLEDLLAVLKLPMRAVFFRPRRRSAGVVGFEQLAASDVTQLLVFFEQLGFEVDPEPLVRALLPEIERKDIITESELSVLWFDKSRHRTTAVELSAQCSMFDWRSEESVRTTTGYKVSVFRNAEGAPVRLVVDAPKFRRRPDPVETVCPECGYRWWKGDPDSSAGHRREDRKRTAILNPEPSANYAAARDVEPEPWLVHATSPKWKHREMHERARAFKREFSYDFIQWEYPDNDPNAQGFLFADEADRILGACAFRLRENDDESWWAMQWIWICPPARRTGILTRWWPEFERRFGAFHPEPPLSDAMQAFLDKRSAENAVSAQSVEPQQPDGPSPVSSKRADHSTAKRSR